MTSQPTTDQRESTSSRRNQLVSPQNCHSSAVLPSGSVLVLESGSRLGVNLLRSLAAHPGKPIVHAFTRSASDLSKTDTALCDSVVEGDASKSSDIARALLTTKADTVIMPAEERHSKKKKKIHTATAKALSSILREDPMLAGVRVVVVSTLGAGGSKIKFGFGRGKVLAFVLRNVINDHNGQEEAFMEYKSLRHRTLVVRATTLTDGKAKGGVVTFGDTDKAPNGHVDRADLAKWIVDEICDVDTSQPTFGMTVNVSG